MASRIVYLDHNATTPMRPEVVDEIARVSRDAFGNPGSRHSAGRAARKVLESARERLATLLGALPSEVIFTSGGTESINLAIQGLRGQTPGVLVAPAGEHPATEQTLTALAQRGWRRVSLSVDHDGLLEPRQIAELPWEETRLVTALLAHNETGVVQSLRELTQRCAEQRVPLHLDAVQAVGKIPVNFHGLGATALSLGAHKFCGPRGIGALLLREGVRLEPWLRGGHQERERRAGTECVALAAGMALALELWQQDYSRWMERIVQLRERLLHGLLANSAPAHLIGHPTARLPNTLNIAFPGCDGEALLVALDLEGICCSLGGTCSSGAVEVSPVLKAMEVPVEWHRSCLRLSVGGTNTPEEIDLAVERIGAVVARLR